MAAKDPADQEEQQLPLPHPFWQRAGGTIERVLSWFDSLVTVTEVLVALVLAVTGAWLLVDLVVTEIGSGRLGAIAATQVLLDRILLIFVIVELFRIAVAYARHEAVLHTVFEAAIVAVARKFVLFDFKESALAGAAAYGLLVAVAVAGYVAVERVSRTSKAGKAT